MLVAMPRLSAQDDPVVIEMAGQQIRQSEFMHDFGASIGNKLASNPKTTESEKRDALREYAELFAIFRAKLADAHRLGIDTARDLQLELAQYRSELAAPYLIDSTVLQDLLREAYERNHRSLHAAHILVRLAPDASAEDSARVYDRIMELRKRIVEGGEDFFAVAGEVAQASNPDEPVRPNEGDLGYFTAFDMVYPFENAAYALEVGEVSQPVRTKYGYHLIKLLDVVNLHGRVDVAHIWVSSRDSLSRKPMIDDCYRRLQEGTSFEMVARQSDDRTTRDNGGLMQNAPLYALPAEYLHVIENMKPGEYTKPFFTQYGWHIVKLVNKEELGTLEEMTPYYKQKMTRDQRGDASRKTFAQNSRKKYGVVDLTTTPVKSTKKLSKKQKPKMMANLDELYAIVPPEATRRLWNYHDSLVTDVHVILQLPDREYTTLDLARYIASHQRAERELKPKYFVDMQYQNFIDSVTVLYADSQLEKEYPEFAAIVEEYRRGLTIFSYNSQKIWNKALFDTVGFSEYYQRESAKKSLDVPSDSIYFWHKRARITTYTLPGEDCLPQEKARKILSKGLKKNKGSLEMKEMLVKGMAKKCPDGKVGVEPELVEQTRQSVLEEGWWQRGVWFKTAPKGYRAVVVEEILGPELKTQTEARGYYLNGYQNELEQKLNSELKQQYGVKINWDVVDKIRY